MIELSENISEYLRDNFGEKYLSNYEEYVRSEYQTYIRISPFTDDQKLISDLRRYNITLEKHESIEGVYSVLTGNESLGKTIEYTFGKYYIQSLSSMIPALILNPGPGDKVLDLCAAPGSKTSQLAELMNNRGTLIANESNLNRIKTLIHNLDKMNLVNLGVIKFKGELLSKNFDHFFDKVLVDAPCSALGIVQKKGEVSNWWKLPQAEKLSELQLRLLISGIKMAKTGADIVYSTCTLTLEENELVLNKVLKNYPVELVDIQLPLKSNDGLTQYQGADLNPELVKSRRIVPWEVSSEGFFIAKLKKIDSTDTNRKIEIKSRGRNLLSYNNKNIKKYLADISDWFGIPTDILSNYRYLINGKDIYFIDKDWEIDDLNIFLRIGAKFGNIDKRNTAHLHSIAAQTLGIHATKNTAVLESLDELKIYLTGATLKRNFLHKGQKIAFYNNSAIGTAISFDEGLKSQFPRSLRTNEIEFK
ncbi:MAG: RsmB/NOP family class I SAM-dependent RNA methyltransferase [Melioribacteraceae bacterium]|nr:RsmB/NOP family class I SAM-dependent RNA methyltransferase [Melioribacteraceae bacterium]MCF8353798.1 RsmB/NOP family class I SAM-dependent RNA methyltransferase [Melioribacteraceae bacterium]MCF8393634.1 RsmB/NOP family class I SAM-dependent RNA methyltransferase [Melioribacteraceae bacterium]MCF8419444.1 RsmB/NOP family class I SAM-dependent RNA methyltransferase [Melioribacteraceae bacterium]